MKSMKISEANGLYVVETSSGVRGTGASLESALKKVAPVGSLVAGNGEFHGIRVIFDAIPSAQGGQFHQGVASA